MKKKTIKRFAVLFLTFIAMNVFFCACDKANQQSG